MIASKPTLVFLLASACASIALAAKSEDGICRATCTGDICTFNAKVNLFAGELGYYTFEECNGTINPTLGMEIGKSYRFIQADRSNYYHPLGFAYFADGAHADVDELEPGIAPPGSDSTCGTDMSCPAPMYLKNEEYLGTYSNDASVSPITTGEDNFGLDDYEPLFFHPLPEWNSYGPFSISLKFDDEMYQKDIFYFCHIHQFMTGRIKLLKDDEPIQPAIDLPALGYEYDAPGSFDQACGTFGLEEFQLPHPECPEKFVCGVPSSLTQFASCIDAMDCHMVSGMTTGVKSNSEVALFIHQMIPHHQNAVNMAKALLKTGSLNCDDLEDEKSDCALEIILREIINGQNAQIQSMRAILEAKSYPQEDDCKVEIGKSTPKSTSASTRSFVSPVTSLVVGVIAYAFY
jgi:hypothetical protein